MAQNRVQHREGAEAAGPPLLPPPPPSRDMLQRLPAVELRGGAGHCAPVL